jgi:molecular chaperone DnaK (HSP70)
VAPRFIVGIDLGTTNCALAAVSADPGVEAPPIEVRDVPQLVNPNEVAARSLLPSFLYLPSEVDFPAGSLALPWTDGASGIVGELARKRGAENPVRLVASAKSWLSHGAANRSGAILPWGAPSEVTKVSPVDASAAYLRHLRYAWNHETGGRLEDQDVLLTVPASFDEEARVLTVRAAAEGGLGHVTLLEEPQAAFYAWIAAPRTSA